MVVVLYKDNVPELNDLKLVTRQEIIINQMRNSLPEGLQKDENGICRKEANISIPYEILELMLRIFFEAHSGERGHHVFPVELDTSKYTGVRK